ncbi:MAG: DNA polymerase I [Alphaproteobacteria bacterium]|nr:DNA polymerase I [Alphaproteobacteria bacterium]
MSLLRPPLRVEGRGPLTGAPLKKGDHLYLIDGSGYLFRAYHALPPLSRKSDGLPTGAVSGYCNMLWKLLEDMKGGDRPTHLAVIFDAGKKTFRNDIYPQYKANRPEPPEDLIPQFPLVRDATRAFGVACVEEKGFEADDLIATYARLAREAGARVTIVSSDKDLMQLVEDGKVQLFDTMKNKRIGSAEVIERFGVPPSKVVEVQALAGDSTDNVPGVPGIGVKTAAELINTYGDLETLLKRAGEIKQPKRRETLLANVEKARLSQKLVLLDDHAKLTQTPDTFSVREPDPAELLAFLKTMEFASLTKRAAAHYGVEDTGAIAAVAVAVTRPEGVGKLATGTASPSNGGAVGAVANRQAILKPIDHAAYETVTALARLEQWIARAHELGTVCVDTETTSLDAMQAGLCGVSLALAPNEACYIPCGHVAGEGLSFDGGRKIAQLAETDVLGRLKPLLEDESVLKIGQNLKYDYLIFRQHGITVAPFDDTMLMSYVLDAGLQGHGMDELSEKYLGHKPISFADVAGKGKEKVTFDQVPVAEATRYSAEDADVTLRLWMLLKPRLAAERKRTVYETLERPLAPVLAEMERAGIAIDPDLLRKLSNDFAQAMAALESEIHKLAGETFNVASPKQLGDILFGKFSLPGGRKTKTGAWSTDADVLEELATQGHDLPKKVLDWRQLAKLRGTYTDALPTYINPRTGRVHTSFAMAAAATGRLASTDPNLQNIPIRTPEGRRIRQAFIAPKGSKLISADYSQIELRILAYMADIAALKKAFSEGLDIHAMTASEIFGVPVKGMPAEVRRRAKAINFGIVYGISGFGLANQLGIARSEADDYIKKYFQRFPGIRDYMESTKEFAREHGYVETLFGRRIHIREIRSNIQGLRGGAERAAINAPIQGTAADIIRRAMIRMPDALAAAKLKARMLLQVHDELVFEAVDAEVEKTSAVAVSVMEQASLPAVPLSVKLTVEARAAQNWDAAH